MSKTSSPSLRSAVSALAVGVLSVAPAGAQTSASFKLTEATINDGGNPNGASSLASAHFHIKLDAIGDAVVGRGLSSASYHSDEGFVGDYPPPGQVTGLRFGGKTTLVWDPLWSAVKYEVYRGPNSTLSAGTYGTCFASNLTVETATDASTPSVGQGNFYLVTARNRLREEGPKGYRSNGTVEGNPAPCP